MFVSCHLLEGGRGREGGREEGGGLWLRATWLNNINVLTPTNNTLTIKLGQENGLILVIKKTELTMTNVLTTIHCED